MESLLYRSERIGKNGKPFSAYKIRTLKDGTDKKSSYAQEDQYLKFGKFLRKYKLDELPQILNVLKGEMSLVGPRPEEARTIKIIPKDIRNILLSVRPGLTSLSSIHFVDEERLLQGANSSRDYWLKIKPLKITLDAFYVEHRSFTLDLLIIWMTIKVIFKQVFK